MSGEAMANWLRAEDAPQGGVVLRHIEFHSGPTGLVDERACAIAEVDLARLFHALEAAARKWPAVAAEGAEAPAGELFAAPKAAAWAWERTIVERSNERVAIVRGDDGRFILNSQRLVQRDSEGQMFSGVSVALDPRDVVAAARALIESLDPALAQTPKAAGEETLVEHWDTKLTIAAGNAHGALLGVRRRVESTFGEMWKLACQFPIDEGQLLRLAHAALSRREAIEP
ncbi:MAG: hypothetical protein WAN43_16305 [Rhodomicrobium sp.]